MNWIRYSLASVCSILLLTIAIPANGQTSNPTFGTVYWPDGTAASNVLLDLEPAPGDQLTYFGDVEVATDSYGGYQVNFCPCPQMMGVLVLPVSLAHGAPCTVIMAAGGQSYAGVSAQPSQEVDWMVAPIRCNGNGIPRPEHISWALNSTIGPSWQQVRQLFLAKPAGAAAEALAWAVLHS